MQMRTQLHTESVCRDLILADMHDAQPLKNECLQYIASHTHDIMRVSAFALHCNKMYLYCALASDGRLARVARQAIDVRSSCGEGWPFSAKHRLATSAAIAVFFALVFTGNHEPAITAAGSAQ